MSSLRQYTATQTLKFLAVGMLATAGAHAGATTLQITPSQSQVTYTPGTGFPICSFDGSGNISCPVAPAPETANLSGLIDLNVVHEHWEIRGNVVDRDLIYLTTRNFSAGTLSPVFPLAGAVGLLTGNTFQVRDDPCFLSVDSQCSWSGYAYGSWGADGTWDGKSLVWTGWSSERFGDGLAYTINAQALSSASPVPEPSAAILFGLGLLTIISRHQRQRAAQA